MKTRINILFIAFLLVFASSCTKFTPLERVSPKSNAVNTDSEGKNDVMLKSASSDDLDNPNSNSNITDPDHDEDFDADADVNITDTDNEEDYDKEGK